MQKFKILYLDDTPNSSIVFRFEHLFSPPVDITVVTNITWALEEMRSNDPFDVIISDGQLTEGDTGIIFYTQIKDVFRGNFILFSASDEIIKIGEELGIEIVPKGDSDFLFETVKEILELKISAN